MHLVSPLPVQPLLAAAPPKGPTYSEVFAGDKAVGTDPTIQDYFNDGTFPAGMADPESQLLWIIAGTIVNGIPLARTVVAPFRLLPPLRLSVDDAIARNSIRDKMNYATGTLVDKVGPYIVAALPATATFVGLSLYHDTFRVPICYLAEAVWLLGGVTCAFLLGRANKRLLGRVFVTPYKLYLRVRGRYEELKALNQLIADTRLQRRHYLGIFAPSLPKSEKTKDAPPPEQARES